MIDEIPTRIPSEYPSEEPEAMASSVPSLRPFEHHEGISHFVRQIQVEGFTVSRWNALLQMIDVALLRQSNDGYRRGQIDQHDEPLPSDAIAQLKAEGK